MIKKSIVLLFAALLMPCGVSLGQTSNAYGVGVHKYFSGCHQEAIASFNAAIAENPNDARAFYFRGLAQLCTGNTCAADADFQQGAFIETSSKHGRSSLVNRSLERIQGHTRLRIERFRGNNMALTPSTAIAGTQVPYNQTFVSQEFVSQPIAQPAVCQPQIVQQPVYQQSQVYSSPIESGQSVFAAPPIESGGIVSSPEPVLAPGTSETFTSNPPLIEAPASNMLPAQHNILQTNDVPVAGDSHAASAAVQNLPSAADVAAGEVKQNAPVPVEEPLTDLTNAPADPLVVADEATETKAPPQTELIETITDRAKEVGTGAETPAASEKPFGFETPVDEKPAATEEPFGFEAPATEKPMPAEAPAASEEPFGFEAPAATEKPAAVEAPVETPLPTEEPAATEEPFGFEAPLTEEPAAVEAPASPLPTEEPAATEEPFGFETPAIEEPAAPAATEEPAADPADPFGAEEKPAEEPPAADPFG